MPRTERSLVGAVVPLVVVCMAAGFSPVGIDKARGSVDFVNAARGRSRY